MPKADLSKVCIFCGYVFCGPFDYPEYKLTEEEFEEALQAGACNRCFVCQQNDIYLW